MKTRVCTLTLLFILGIAPAALLAQSSTNSGKVGVIRIQEAIVSTAEGKKAMADLQKNTSLASKRFKSKTRTSRPSTTNCRNKDQLLVTTRRGA